MTLHKVRITLLLFLLFFISSAVFPINATIKIACVGDSITEGWILPFYQRPLYSYPAQLQQKLGNGYEVRNYGAPGTTIYPYGIPWLQSTPYMSQISDWQPDAIVIILGTNDAAYPVNATLFYNYYANLLDRFISLTKRPVIYICTPPKAFDFRAYTVDNYIMPLVIDVYRNYMNYHGADTIKFIDINSYTNFPQYYPDALHPDITGMGIIAVKVYDSIRSNQHLSIYSNSRNPYYPYFDVNYYINAYPDVYFSGMDPIDHYFTWGWRERRNPSVYFDTNYYLNTYPDIRLSGVEPLSHYLNWGWRERRNPSNYFDTNYYLWQYPDVTNAGVEPLSHYLNHGWKEKRNPSAYFNTNYYLTTNTDVANAGIEPLAHYLNHGWKEKRNPSAYFNTNYYLTTNTDVANAGIEPLAHYLNHGWKERRNPSLNFNTQNYLSIYSDVRNAGIEPLKHFIEFGQREGRVPNP